MRSVDSTAMRAHGDAPGHALARCRPLILARACTLIPPFIPALIPALILVGALTQAAFLGAALAQGPAETASSAHAPHAHEPAAKKGVPVKVHDNVLLTLEQPLLGKSPAERAQAASKAITAAIDAETETEVRVERAGELATIWANKMIVIALAQDDAGGVSLDTYSGNVAAKLREVIKEERKRSEIADTVFALSAIVFWALIALYGLRKAGEAAHRAYAYLVEHPERIPGIEVRSFEVVGPKALHAALLALIAVGRYAAQLSILYIWLVFALSRFETTRPLTEKLTNLALKPLSELAIRFAATLPIALVVLVFGAAVYVLVRFTRLFFASIASGATKLDGLPRDLAGPTGALVSIGIVLAAIVIAGPLVTGDAEGALARTGGVALLALALAATPLLATGLIGARLVFGRRLSKGEHVELAGRSARVRELTLLEVRLIDDDGAELRVPHLLSLVTPLKVLGRKPRATVELWLAPNVPVEAAIETLTSGASEVGEQVRVQLLDAHAGGCLYRVALMPLGERNESDVRIALLGALSEKGFPLGPTAHDRVSGRGGERGGQAP